MHLLYLVYFVNTSCLLFFALTYGCINTAYGVWAPLVGVGQLNNSSWWLQMPWCRLDTKPSATATLTPQWTQCNTNHVSQHASRVKLKWKFFVSSWIGSCRFDNLRRQWQQWCLRVQPMTKIWPNFVHAPSQWETTLQSNVVPHWLGAYKKWSLNITKIFVSVFILPAKFEDIGRWATC